MPVFERAGVSLYYEEYGSGYPLLLFAPGGMRSSIDFWRRSPFDPTAELANDFRVIAMDQRNAGRSRAPVSADDGWETYAGDHLALLDHLGARRAHVMGGCIGSSYCLGLIKLAPERVSAAVLQNPIGLSPENRAAFYEMFDGWASDLRKARPELSEEAFKAFRARMYDGDFVFCKYLAQHVGHQLRRARRKFGGLDHGAVAGRNCGRQRHQAKTHRIIPRRDDADDA